jgi:hypothetical protein
MHKTKHYHERELEHGKRLENIKRVMPVNKAEKHKRDNLKTYTAAIICEESTVIAVVKGSKIKRLITIY